MGTALTADGLFLKDADVPASAPSLSQAGANDVTKTGFLNKLSGSRKGVWQRRFFELKEFVLTYRKKDGPSGKALYVIPVEDVTRVDAVEDEKYSRQWAFEIGTPGRTFAAQAKDTAERDEWMAAITLAASQAHGGAPLSTAGGNVQSAAASRRRPGVVDQGSVLCAEQAGGAQKSKWIVLCPRTLNVYRREADFAAQRRPLRAFMLSEDIRVDVSQSDAREFCVSLPSGATSGTVPLALIFRTAFADQAERWVTEIRQCCERKKASPVAPSDTAESSEWWLESESDKDGQDAGEDGETARDEPRSPESGTPVRFADPPPEDGEPPVPSRELKGAGRGTGS